MPNWSKNQVTIIGKKENLLAFLNEGLKNSGLLMETDVPSAIKALKEGATTESSKEVLDADGNYTGMREVITEKCISMRTFLPMPHTFLVYDTTNRAKDYPEAAKFQQTYYGAVGWYDYNLLTLGTKWNAELEGFDGDEKTIRFTCNTAWSQPTIWFEWVAETFDLKVFGMFTEEANFYCETAKYTKDGYELIQDFMPLVNQWSEENKECDWGDDYEEYFERLSDFEENLDVIMETSVFKAICKTGKEELGWD